MPESSIDARLRDGLINDVVVATPVRYLHKKEEEVIWGKHISMSGQGYVSKLIIFSGICVH